MVAFKDLAKHLDSILLPAPSDFKVPEPAPVASPRLTSAGRTCKYCPGAVFEDMDEFRAHHQTAWHCHNQDLSLRSKTAISLEEFESIAGNVSSSDSEENFWEESEEEGISAYDDQDAGAIDPLVRFSCGGKGYSLYRSLLFSSKQEYRSNLVSDSFLKDFISAASTSSWALFLLKGGRVFAAIYDHTTQRFTKTKQFKRYTERRKQGGSQMLRDKSGKVAKSAGSQIRRQNEQNLLRDVEDLVKNWVEDLKKCQFIFWNRTFFGQAALFPAGSGGLGAYKEQLRTFPFTTYKPCEEEALRCVNKFCSLEK